MPGNFQLACYRVTTDKYPTYLYPSCIFLLRDRISTLNCLNWIELRRRVARRFRLFNNSRYDGFPLSCIFFIYITELAIDRMQAASLNYIAITENEHVGKKNSQLIVKSLIVTMRCWSTNLGTFHVCSSPFQRYHQRYFLAHHHPLHLVFNRYLFKYQWIQSCLTLLNSMLTQRLS